MEMSGAQIVDFNCTIQELKLNYNMYQPYTKDNFNCTIQELKRL